MNRVARRQKCQPRDVCTLRKEKVHETCFCASCPSVNMRDSLLPGAWPFRLRAGGALAPLLLVDAWRPKCAAQPPGPWLALDAQAASQTHGHARASPPPSLPRARAHVPLFPARKGANKELVGVTSAVLLTQRCAVNITQTHRDTHAVTRQAHMETPTSTQKQRKRTRTDV